MKEYLKLLRLPVAIIMVGFIGFGSWATAAQPRVYELYDANNVYLGDVLSVSSGIFSDGLDVGAQYVTYLPSLGVVMQYTYDSNYFNYGVIRSSPHNVYFPSADCIGDMYVSNDGFTNAFTGPWAIRFEDQMYKIDEVKESLLFQSYKTTGTPECLVVEGNNTYQQMSKLISITLPFDISSIETPFKLQRP